MTPAHIATQATGSPTPPPAPVDDDLTWVIVTVVIFGLVVAALCAICVYLKPWQTQLDGTEEGHGRTTTENNSLHDPHRHHPYGHRSAQFRAAGHAAMAAGAFAGPNQNDGQWQWEQLTDPNTGHQYWHNTHTNETSWDPPLAKFKAAAMAAQFGARMQAGTSSWHKQSNTMPNDAIASNSESSEQCHAYEPASSAGVVSNSDDGWQQLTDPHTGQQYWHNVYTNETSW